MFDIPYIYTLRILSKIVCNFFLKKIHWQNLFQSKKIIQGLNFIIATPLSIVEVYFSLAFGFLLWLSRAKPSLSSLGLGCDQYNPLERLSYLEKITEVAACVEP